MAGANRSTSERLIVLIAEGFGVGRIPFAPGTFGSAAAFGWVYLLLIPRNLLFYFAGIVIGFFLAVWVGGRAEQILGEKDPGRIVIDEITAIPLAFLPALIGMSNGLMTPDFSMFTSGSAVFLALLAFGFFRLFDIWKPLGIRRVQTLPGGWGLVVDDFLAAAAAAALLTVCVVLWK